MTAARSATARGREVYAVVREFVAEVEARLDERIGLQKMRTLRGRLEELGAAL